MSYREIQAHVREKYGISIETCWIAHVKEKLGLPLRTAPNRRDPNKRIKPCPPDKEKYIVEAFKLFGII